MIGVANHYSQEQLDWLRDHRATLTGACTRHRFMAGSTGQYKKGNVPYNAGKAGLLPFKPNSGQFNAPGNQNNAKNKLPVGSITVTSDGFLKLKIADPSQWVLKHRHIWESAHGAVPPKHGLRFIDGNPQNCALENLECLPKAVSLLMNHSDYRQQHDALKPAIKANCFLKNAIREKTREYDHG